MNQQRQQSLILAIVVALVVLFAWGVMGERGERMASQSGEADADGGRVALGTEALIPPPVVAPPPTEVLTNISSALTYNVNPIAVMTNRTLRVYNLPKLSAVKIGTIQSGYSWIVTKIASDDDGNYWAAIGSGWVLLYDAQVYPPETADWSLDKWIQNGKQ